MQIKSSKIQPNSSIRVQDKLILSTKRGKKKKNNRIESHQQITHRKNRHASNGNPIKMLS